MWDTKVELLHSIAIKRMNSHKKDRAYNEFGSLTKWNICCGVKFFKNDLWNISFISKVPEFCIT